MERPAEKLCGWTKEEVLGRNIAEVIVQVNSREESEAISKRLKAGESWSTEFLARRKDGSL